MARLSCCSNFPPSFPASRKISAKPGRRQKRCPPSPHHRTPMGRQSRANARFLFFGDLDSYFIGSGIRLGGKAVGNGRRAAAARLLTPRSRAAACDLGPHFRAPSRQAVDDQAGLLRRCLCVVDSTVTGRQKETFSLQGMKQLEASATNSYPVLRP